MRVVALDLIRFFAALGVVLYHYLSREAPDEYPFIGEVAKYGYLGVPIFFMISGYIIAVSANNRLALQFALSRVVRLYPALWAAIIFTVGVLTVFTDKRYSLFQVAANFTLLNEYLGFADIDGVYWTLKAELKFYACIFLLLAFGVFQKYHIWLSVWLGMAVLHIVCAQPFFMGWFISPIYSPFFISGVAFFLIKERADNLYAYGVLILSAVAACARIYDLSGGFMHDPTVTNKIISVSVILLFYGLMYCLSVGRFFLKENNFFVTLGAITYPLYLIHNLAGRAIIDYFSDFFPEKIVVFFVILSMFCFSWCIHQVIEKPLSHPLKKYLSSCAWSLYRFARRTVKP